MAAFYTRNKWRRFRNQFNDLRFCPLLDYSQYRNLKTENTSFRFSGEIESITDGQTLWVKGGDLTIPVLLEPRSELTNTKTKCFLLPKHAASARADNLNESSPPEGKREHDAPEQIRWNRVSTLSEGTKVFIGGQVKMYDNRFCFCSVKGKPLTVIFYNCPDTDLTNNIIRSARTRNEYWNSFTPIFLVIGALTLLFLAAAFLGRPAFHLNVITAFIAVFIPLLPVIPPGFLFTFFYRRFTWKARKLRIESDIVRFGINSGAGMDSARRYAIRAYLFETIAWGLMLLGIFINIIFIYILLSQLGII